MKALELILTAACSVLLCKAAALGLILLFFQIKKKTAHLDSEGWDRYFRTLDSRKLTRMFAVLYGTAAAFSSLAAFAVLRWLDFRYAGLLAVLFLMIRVALTAFRWKKHGSAFLESRLSKLRNGENA